MLSRRTLLAPSAATLAAPRLLRAQPAAPGVIGRLQQVYFRVLSEAGGTWERFGSVIEGVRV